MLMGDVLVLALPPLVLGIWAWGSGRMGLRGTPSPVEPHAVPEHLERDALAHRSWDGDRGERQLGGNILLFVPLGSILPLAVPRCRSLGATVTAGALFSVAIESIQLIEPLHSTDIDDVAPNVLGTAIGYGMYAAVVAVTTSRNATPTVVRIADREMCRRPALRAGLLGAKRGTSQALVARRAVDDDRLPRLATGGRGHVAEPDRHRGLQLRGGRRGVARPGRYVHREQGHGDHRRQQDRGDPCAG